MIAASILDRLASSRSYVGQGPVQRRLIEALAQVLDGTARPLAEICRRLGDEREIPREERSPAGVERVLQRFGLFRFDAQGSWYCVSAALLDRPLAELPLAFLDLETTGGRPPLHRMIEVGVIRREPGRPEEAFETLVDPVRPLPRFVASMTGLDDARLRQAPPASEVLPEILARLAGAVIVAHNPSTELAMLDYELHRAGRPFLDHPVVCTEALAQAMEPREPKVGLLEVARRNGLGEHPNHRALEDARTTRRIWDSIRPTLEVLDMTRVVDLLPFQGLRLLPSFIEGDFRVEQIVGAPEAPGLYRLFDGSGRPLLARAVPNLRSALCELFFPAHALSPDLRRSVRDVRRLEMTVQPDVESARRALGQTTGPERPRRARGRRSRRR